MSAPVALRVTLSPKQIEVALSDGVTVGFAFTVIVLVSDASQPADEAAVTVYVAVAAGTNGTP